MTRDRESVSLAGPPDDPAALKDFPARPLSPDTALFRVTRIDNGPWWFGSSMAGLSDMTARKASGFGITSEIGSITPYHLPQAWAARLRAAGSHGIVYWLRHDPSRVEGFALFGLHGERADWPWETEDPEGIPRHLIALLEEACGIQVLENPGRDHLRIIGD